MNNAATGDQFFQFSDLVSTAERINVNVEIKHSWVKGVSAMSCDVMCLCVMFMLAGILKVILLDRVEPSSLFSEGDTPPRDLIKL